MAWVMRLMADWCSEGGVGRAFVPVVVILVFSEEDGVDFCDVFISVGVFLTIETGGRRSELSTFSTLMVISMRSRMGPERRLR